MAHFRFCMSPGGGSSLSKRSNAFSSLSANFSRSCCSRSLIRWTSKARACTFSVICSTRVRSSSMSCRFLCVSFARKSSCWTYSKSCFNTLDNCLNFLQVMVNACGHLATFGPFPDDIFLNGADLRQMLVDERQISGLSLREAICRCGFRYHNCNLALREPIAINRSRDIIGCISGTPLAGFRYLASRAIYLLTLTT
jgi:hypothetical protein